MSRMSSSHISSPLVTCMAVAEELYLFSSSVERVLCQQGMSRQRQRPSDIRLLDSREGPLSAGHVTAKIEAKWRSIARQYSHSLKVKSHCTELNTNELSLVLVTCYSRSMPALLTTL
jgi:hypothetical protein